MNDPYIIVSADSHAGLPTAEYRQYLDAKFHPQFDEFLSERDAALEASTMLGVRNEDYAKNGLRNTKKRCVVVGMHRGAIKNLTATV